MEEYSVRAAPKVAGKKYNLFKMHKDDEVSWTEAKMKRENDYQPWQIKLGSGRNVKRFKATKEGTVGQNASYFIFYKPKDSPDTYEVRPIDDWYTVSATQRYKTLTSEEVDQKWEQRHRTLNLFSVMLKKNGEEGGSATDSKAFKISEMDDWDQSGEDFGDSENEDGGEEDRKKKKYRRKSAKQEKDDAENPPEEGKEDSDEGDYEQREVDYMSDSSSESSDSESGAKDETDVKGIAEMEALRDLLSTDDEEDAEGSPKKKSKPVSNKNSLGTMDGLEDAVEDGSDDSSDSDYEGVEDDKMDEIFTQKGLPVQSSKQEVGQEQVSYSNAPQSSPSTSTATKRKLESATPSTSQPAAPPQSPPKRPCPPALPANSHEKIIEDLVKKYLSRKPMTLKQILQKIKGKLKEMGGVTTEVDNELVNTLASIIKRLNTERQKINNTIYVSLKP